MVVMLLYLDVIDTSTHVYQCWVHSFIHTISTLALGLSSYFHSNDVFY